MQPAGMALSESPDYAAQKLLSTLPPALFAFSYGSAVFPQVGVPRSDRRMLDLIVAVDDAERWHDANMARNPQHYSLPMRLMGAVAVAAVQRSSFGARVYYNTLLPFGADERSFKYGVVCVDDLECDLRNWESLYVSGRMHKPIRVLSSAPFPRGLVAAMRSNIEAATAAALLTLPERFQEDDLYNAAAGLSYAGDVRMAVAAEVAGKVPNIVRANLDHFRSLYSSAVDEAGVARAGASGIWRRHAGVDGQARLLRRLPRDLRRRIGIAVGLSEREVRSSSTEALARRDSAVVGKAVLAAVAGIVTRSSLRQSVKGVLTAGLGTSARYAAAKFQKSLSARLAERALPLSNSPS